MPELSLAERGDAAEPPEATRGSDEPRGVDIGARLLKLRRSRQLTLQDVSTMTGVSASAFSKIERNELSPTISTMQRIAHGLEVELVTLLATDEGAGAVSFAGRRSISRAGTGSKHTTGTCNNVLLCADLKNKRATPILTTVTARSPDEYAAWAKSEAEIFVMVLEGTLVVHSRLYEPLELNKGDSVYYDATTEHTWTSKGPTNAVVLWVLVDL
ncbi:helix-turn-helix domain-containing protein [Bosea sp. F3-2]|uniref:helix-turn-helix domain-containing protein n=1 Tax=Bosea sp. F3-2 TaxID=2599640 RepID=UPI0011F09645|nr:XRE family transcriptional regulator [Bosea sp. F3-2]QEL24913.1 helix-turn-helix domain-containing protein [Bosea sp. F3-2]